MTGDPGERLTHVFRRLPAPGEEATRRARVAALATIHPRPRGRRAAVRFAAAVVVAVALLTAVAAALAASGAVTIELRPASKRASTELPQRLLLPAGASALARLGHGSLTFVGRKGALISGLPASAVAVSPHALYVAVGLGKALVVLAPNGRRAWVHGTGGRVEAIAWAPDGLRIAYVVSTHAGAELRQIEGNGARDRLVDPRVRRVRPSWRSDSLALAFVGAGGRVVVHDFERGGTETLGARCGPARALAYAPSGRELAAATPRGLLLLRDGRRHCERLAAHIDGIAWAGARLVAALTENGAPAISWLRVFETRPALAKVGSRRVAGRLVALTANARTIAFAYRQADGGELAATTLAETSPRLRAVTTLERLVPPTASVFLDLR